MTWSSLPCLSSATRLPAAQRAAEIEGWAFPTAARQAFYEVVGARRDIRRFRPDPVDPTILRVLTAAHQAPSVGQSQPWRFIVVSDPAIRERAARMADEQRIRQARQPEADAARRLLDLQLEGIREAPLGVIVACDRRTRRRMLAGRRSRTPICGRAPAPSRTSGSAARAEGLGVGWVTLFDQDELEALVGVPPGVVTLGWLCLRAGPTNVRSLPGLERAGWSRSRQPSRRSSSPSGGARPHRHRRRTFGLPATGAVVRTRDEADTLLTPPAPLGLLDRYVDRVEAAAQGRRGAPSGQLRWSPRHRLTAGISAYRDSVTDDVLAASRAGESAGAVAAAANGLDFSVVDAGSATGDLVTTDALSAEQADLLERGRALGEAAGQDHVLVALGEVGTATPRWPPRSQRALLALPATELVGLRTAPTPRWCSARPRWWRLPWRGCSRYVGRTTLVPEEALAALGGPEFCVLAGVILGAAAVGALSVLDGLATSVAALVAVRIEPGAAAYPVAGQRSRERAHAAVLEHLGLEPLLDLRLRAGEGVGAALASAMLTSGLKLRRGIGRTSP